MPGGTKAQAVVPVVGSDPVGPSNPMPVTDAGLADVIAAIGTRTSPADTQPISASVLPLPNGAASAADIAGLDDSLHLLLRALGILITRLPMPTAAQELRCRLESGNNAAMNINQWGGQTAAIGAGASGNGAPRVTPANDTVAGVPHIYAFHGSLDTRNFRNRIVT